MDTENHQLLQAAINSGDVPVALTSLKSLTSEQIEIDLTEVNSLGARIVQLLLSAKRHWETQNMKFIVINASEEILDAISRLDAGELIMHGDAE